MAGAYYKRPQYTQNTVGYSPEGTPADPSPVRKRIRFGLDLDGVFGDFGGLVKIVAGRLWPGKLPADYVPQNWDYTDVFSKDDWNQVWIEIKKTPNFWLGEGWYIDSVASMKDFISKHDNLEVYYITSRASTAGLSVLEQSYRWLQNREIFLDGKMSLIPVQDAAHKESICAGLKLPFMLDDYAPTIQKLLGVEGMQPYLLDQPWNRYADHLPRVYSVGQYLDIVSETLG